jgi:hypothetical protein
VPAADVQSAAFGESHQQLIGWFGFVSGGGGCATSQDTRRIGARASHRPRPRARWGAATQALTQWPPDPPAIPASLIRCSRSVMSAADCVACSSTSGGRTLAQPSLPRQCATACFSAGIIGYFWNALRIVSNFACSASTSAAFQFAYR